MKMSKQYGLDVHLRERRVEIYVENFVAYRGTQKLWALCFVTPYIRL